jgi:hypothetical protein
VQPTAWQVFWRLGDGFDAVRNRINLLFVECLQYMLLVSRARSSTEFASASSAAISKLNVKHFQCLLHT